MLYLLLIAGISLVSFLLGFACGSDRSQEIRTAHAISEIHMGMEQKRRGDALARALQR